MRVAKSDIISGLPASAARALMRRMMHRKFNLAGIAHWLDVDEHTAKDHVEALVADGYLNPGEHSEGLDETVWGTSIKGNALAQASFGPPMKRSKADELLQAVIHRAGEYNADPTRLLTITEIRVFGSYLNSEVQELGDLDLALRYVQRNPETYWDDMQRQAYAESSPSSLTAEMFYPLKDLHQRLKARSRFIKITTENIEHFTSSWKIVYGDAVEPAA